MEPDPPRTPPPEGEYVEETLEAPPPPAPYPPEEPPPSRDVWPWLLALLIVVLAGLAVLWIVSSDDEESRAPATSPTETPRAARVRVPDVVGLPLEDAVARLADVDLRSRARTVAIEDGEPGTVIAQAPGAGGQLAQGQTVRLDIAARAGATVPAVVGLSAGAAGRRLAEAGFVAAVFSVPSDRPEGVVIAQSPAAGARARRGSRVRLNVSQGSQTETGAGEGTTVTVTTTTPSAIQAPDLVGQTVLLARRRIFARSLRPRTAFVASDEPQGTVVAQQPAAGTPVRSGAVVRIEVSDGPTPARDVPVPDVLGLDEETAVQQLSEAGLEVEIVRETTSDPSEDGVVLYQDPAPDARVRSGTKVAILIGRFR